jgi:DNA-binding transcriptional ArsR family regulator
MSGISSLAETASLIGEPARTAMLVALMDGRALTAGELARAAGVAAPTASGHLARLLEAGMLELDRQGRHRYYRIASPVIAAVIESLMGLASTLEDGRAVPRRPIVTGPRDKALRYARTCYNHLAGEVAVRIADALVERGYIRLAADGAAVTDEGAKFLMSLGIVGGEGSGGPRFCRACLDWSERRHHIAGAVGIGLYQTFLGNDWIRRIDGGRAVAISPGGVIALEKHFGLRL